MKVLFRDRFGWFCWETYQQALDFESLVESLGIDSAELAAVLLFGGDPWGEERTRHGVN